MLPYTMLSPLLLLMPALIMGTAGILATRSSVGEALSWTLLRGSGIAALVFSAIQAALALIGVLPTTPAGGWLLATPVTSLITLLVQALAVVITFNSATSLADEPNQKRYIRNFAWVIGSVHILLVADHWLVLITSWSAVGLALNRLLCFYPERPFALLAAHKKQIADRIADLMLIAAAVIAVQATGSGSVSELTYQVAEGGNLTPSLHLCILLVVLAAILRTALLPVHGWLIQVMEAPTPVSALMHAGVVNLSCAVLIRFAPLLDASPPARAVLVGFGLITAVLAGMVMLTRISIKVRLAWSTCAQMGFMLLEAGLGLYTLAFLHLVGHSLYKAHAFLSASSTVQQATHARLRGPASPHVATLLLAPALSIPLVLAVSQAGGEAVWPWWWSLALGFNWAPLLWVPARLPWHTAIRPLLGRLLMTTLLISLAWLLHAPLSFTADQPNHLGGQIAAAGLACLYLVLIWIHLSPQRLESWRRACYAGFYLDEYFTRLALRIWPKRWVPDAATEPFARFAESERIPGGLSHD